MEEEVDEYWPTSHALKYYRAVLENLLRRVEHVKEKIKKLEERGE